MYVEVDDASPLLLLPRGPPASQARWTESPRLGATWRPVLDRINVLWAMGLTTTMVAADFFCRCIAPLQARPHPTWRYAGDDDASRVARGAEFNPDAGTVATWLGEVMEERDSVVAFLPEGVVPQCKDPEVEIIVGTLPVTDAWGVAHLSQPPPSG